MEKLKMKTTSKNWSRLALQALCALPLGLLGFACDGRLNEPGVGGESSFLRVCADQCGDGLECISNVCTQSCLMSKDSCGKLEPAASCTNASIESGSVAVCDVACTRDDDCGRLGSRFRCDAGFCRGASLGTSNGQGGGAGTSATSSRGGSPGTSGGASGIGGASTPATIGTATAGSCRVAYKEYASGTTGIPIADGSSCGSCSCTNGTLECVKLDFCPLGSPVVPCSADLKTDAVDERLGFIAGDSLTLSVGHGGGCATHDYALCYEQGLGDSLPGYVWLHVIHDGHGDTCEAYLTKPLRFDLTPLAGYLNQAFPSTDLVNTAYGLYVFGDAATCNNRVDATRDQIQRSVADTIKTCTSNADCETIDTSTSCYPTCGAVISNAPSIDSGRQLSKSELSARIAAINAGQCSHTDELQCPKMAIDCAALVPACVNGQCVDSAH